MLRLALDGEVSFVDNPKYLKFLETTAASAVFCSPKVADQVPDDVIALKHEKPYQAYAHALTLLFPTALKPQSITGIAGISDNAFVHPNAFRITAWPVMKKSDILMCSMTFRLFRIILDIALISVWDLLLGVL